MVIKNIQNSHFRIKFDLNSHLQICLFWSENGDFGMKFRKLGPQYETNPNLKQSILAVSYPIEKNKKKSVWFQMWKEMDCS